MTITPGKWRMRNGKMAVVEFRTQAETSWPWMGYMADGKAGTAWADDGGWNGPEQQEQDLIAPWNTPEVNWSAMPAWAKWVAMDSNGNWFWWEKKPNHAEKEWWGDPENHGVLGIIRKAYRPTFSGDWKDSLAERPSA